ncbi:MAG: ATP-binding protein [Bacteroidota bacterium]
MIDRILEKQLLTRLTASNKIVVLYGARQVGKTTLALKLLAQLEGKKLKINADKAPYTEILSSRNFEKLKGLVSGYDVLFIDEAQRIPDIGINLKILHDSLPNLKILVTGSSSLDLANRIKEPLTGRTWTYQLLPVSAIEWKVYKDWNNFEFTQGLEDWLRFGMYPDMLLMENYDDKRAYLDEISKSYLYKDILALAKIRYPEKLRQLLKLLAFQIGNLVSIHELAKNLQVNRDTIINYIDLLEKGFVIFRLSGFSRNLRKEVVSMDKIFFYDLGIRNAILENFNTINSRNDVGQLWENFLLAERIKRKENHKLHGNSYFWRTRNGSELDYVEEKDGYLHGFEFKWKPKKYKKPTIWSETYENTTYQIVHRENFIEFIDYQ